MQDTQTIPFDEDQQARSDAYDTALEQDEELRDGIDELTEFVKQGHVTLAEVGGFGTAELEGGYNAAVSMIESDMAAKGLKIIGTLLTLNPNEAKYYRLAGIALHRLKQYGLADGYYDIALAFDPNDPIAMLYRGETHLFLERRFSARQFLEQGFEQAEGRPELHAIVQRAKAIAQAFGLTIGAS